MSILKHNAMYTISNRTKSQLQKVLGYFGSQMGADTKDANMRRVARLLSAELKKAKSL